MKRPVLSFLLLLAAFVPGACGPEQAGDTAPSRTADALARYDVYGEAFSDEGAVPVQAVTAEPDQYLGHTVTIEGTVAEVCQASGCWLTLHTGGEDPGVRILMARNEDGDYAFTVPKNISGRRVVAQGTLAEETLLEGTQRHLAADAGTEIDESTLQPRAELQLTARGVLVEAQGP